MSLLRLAYIIALRGIISSWKLEMILFLGILLAVTLLASGVVFSDLLAEAALRRALDRSTPQEVNFTVRVNSVLEDPSTTSRRATTHQQGLDFVDQRVDPQFGPYLRDRSRLLETATFFFAGHPDLELADNVRPRGRIKYMKGLVPETRGTAQRAELVKGHWPYSTADRDPVTRTGPLEVAIDTLGAELLPIEVGDEIEVFPAAGAEEPPSMAVKIVGVFRRSDPEDEFWYGVSRGFSFQDDTWTIIPLFTTEDAILGRVRQVYPRLYTNTTWFFYLDRHGIRAGDIPTIQSTVVTVRDDIHRYLANATADIKLDRVLDDYEEELLLARIPLFLVLFLVTGILIYYIALVAVIMVRSRAAEISMLKSRGAATFQIGLLALVEGLGLAVPAVALGPLLALGISRGISEAFFDAYGGGLAPVSLSADAYLLGMGGALLAVAVLTGSTLVAARQGIVEFRQMGARPSRAPFVHRYYLDLLAVALIGVVWWQIQSRGSFLIRPLGTGGLEVDYSHMVVPVLLLLGLALLILRAFPWGLALVARVAEPVAPAWLSQGLKRVSRDPILPGTLVVLVMLTTAVGVIGSAFSSTLERSQRERALYAAGADLRLQHNGDRVAVPLAGLSELVGEIDGVGSAAEVKRTSGSLLTAGLSTPSVAILGVDADHFAQSTWYRSDFAGGKTPEGLMDPIRGSPSGTPPDGIRLPSDATAIAVWVRPDRPYRRRSLRARLQDNRGYYFDIELGRLDSVGWQRLEGKLSPLPPPSSVFRDRTAAFIPTPPLTLLSLHINTLFGGTQPGVLFLEDMSALTLNGEVVLDDFNTIEGWQVVENQSRPGLYALESSESVTRTGTGKSAAFSWTGGGGGDLLGIRAGTPETPIPAVVSRSVLDLTETGVGETLKLALSDVTLLIRPVAVADFFPTLEVRKEPFVVVDLKTLTHYTNLHTYRGLVGGSNELWINLREENPGAGSAHAGPATAVAEALDGRGIRVTREYLASEMVSIRVEQPLVNAGWAGLLVLMFLALVLASASGVMLFSYLDTRERYAEFAILRTIGFSRGQLNGVVWFNLFIMVVCGVGLGTLAGYQIGVSLLPIMEVAEEGVRITPPMVLQTNWETLLVSYLVLAGVTAITVIWLAWLLSKLELQRILRF